jgi:hypothetical protein
MRSLQKPCRWECFPRVDRSRRVPVSRPDKLMRDGQVMLARGLAVAVFGRAKVPTRQVLIEFEPRRVPAIYDQLTTMIYQIFTGKCVRSATRLEPWHCCSLGALRRGLLLVGWRQPPFRAAARRARSAPPSLPTQRSLLRDNQRLWKRLPTIQLRQRPFPCHRPRPRPLRCRKMAVAE